MIPEIEQRSREIETLCREYDVQRLALFGSAATGGFRVNTSDLDFLVEFRAPPSTGTPTPNWPELEVLRTLKGRSAAISLHSTDDEILQRTPVRDLYRLPEH